MFLKIMKMLCSGYLKMNKIIIAIGNDIAFSPWLEKYFGSENIVITECLYFSKINSLISHKRPAIVIIEVVPPYLYGANLLFHLRQQFPEFPALIICKDPEVFSKETAFGLGANAYLAEPFTERQFIEKLIGLLNTTDINVGNEPYLSEV